MDCASKVFLQLNCNNLCELEKNYTRKTENITMKKEM